MMKCRTLFWFFIALVHLYLSWGHLTSFFGGEMTWTHGWKGFGALAGAVWMSWMASGRGRGP